MPTGSTPNYHWPLPTVAGDTAVWGTQLNNNLNSIDTTLYGIANPNAPTISSIPSTSVKGTLTFLNSAATTGQQARWALVEDTVTEAGGNTGSNFSLTAYSDTGVQISTPMVVARATGAVTFSGPLAAKGVIDGSDAAAGQIGEYLAASRASGSALSLTTATAANIVSLALTAGDWDVRGSLAGTASIAGATLVGGLSTTSATFSSGAATQGFAPSGTVGFEAPIIRVSSASSTTVYLVGLGTFASGTVTAYGFISARRVR